MLFFAEPSTFALNSSAQINISMRNVNIYLCATCSALLGGVGRYNMYVAVF